MAGRVLEVTEPHFGFLDLGLALADVVEELRRPEDRVDERPDVREERGCSGAAHQERVGDSPACVGEGEHDEGDPDRNQNQDHQRRGQVQSSVFNSEDGERHGGLKEHPSE